MKSAREIAREIEKMRDALPVIVAAIAEEREACAKLAESHEIVKGAYGPSPGRMIAAAIRARSSH